VLEVIPWWSNLSACVRRRGSNHVVRVSIDLEELFFKHATSDMAGLVFRRVRERGVHAVPGPRGRSFRPGVETSMGNDPPGDCPPDLQAGVRRPIRSKNGSIVPSAVGGSTSAIGQYG
jgi:hypothetical protein